MTAQHWPVQKCLADAALEDKGESREKALAADAEGNNMQREASLSREVDVHKDAEERTARHGTGREAQAQARQDKTAAEQAAKVRPEESAVMNCVIDNMVWLSWG